MLTGVKWKNLDVTSIPQNNTAEDNVTLSTGDTTDLDVVLTDRHGVTKRSEIGKSFIGGE